MNQNSTIPAEVSVVNAKMSEYRLWSKLIRDQKVLSFYLETTARCNNNCRHCYINLPAGDRKAIAAELTLAEINLIADEAIRMGALWGLITGGEPLLRKDFAEMYMLLKKKGLLVSVFTNATLITEDLIQLFKKYPPRDIEVTVYGVTRETYENVTRKKGSFDAFMKGLKLLFDNEIPVSLKAIALRSNLHEMESIAQFCRERSKYNYRFDSVIHLRYDRDAARNQEILKERLMKEEVVFLENNDRIRFGQLIDHCDKFLNLELPGNNNGQLFLCGTGNGRFVISYDGKLKLCSSLCSPDMVSDIRASPSKIPDAFADLSKKVKGMCTSNVEFTERCGICRIQNLCLGCPAHAWLETGDVDKPAEYFCTIAQARAESLQEGVQGTR